MQRSATQSTRWACETFRWKTVSGYFKLPERDDYGSKQSIRNAQGLALRVASFGERHNDTNGEQGKEPARAHMLLFNRY